MSDRTCSLDGCEGAHLARGLCGKHYMDYRRNGRQLPPTEGRQSHAMRDVDPGTGRGFCPTHGPDTEVRLNRSDDGRVKYDCAPRRRELAQARRARDRAAGKKQPVPPRHQVIRYRYGLEWDQYQKMLAAQDGKCGICDVEMTDTPHIDHDHETDAVRGLLCKRCNWGLGWFDDSPEKLLAAYFYLLAHGRSDLAQRPQARRRTA